MICQLTFDNQGPCVLQSLPFNYSNSSQFVCISHVQSSTNVIVTMKLLHGTGNSSVVVGSDLVQMDSVDCIAVPESTSTNYTLVISAFSYFASPAGHQVAMLRHVQLLSGSNLPTG